MRGQRTPLPQPLSLFQNGGTRFRTAPGCYQRLKSTPACTPLRTCASLHGKEIRRVAAKGTASILALFCLVGDISAGAAQQVIEGPARVIDGDTLEVLGEKVRLFGLDAPEKAQSCSDQEGRAYACGLRSKEALETKLSGVPVQCTVKAKDLYGRSVSQCSSPNTGDLGHWLVHNGYAVAYRQYSKAYVADEDEAHQMRQGIWEGEFEVPADWRREHKNGAAGLPQPRLNGPSLTTGQNALLKTVRTKLTGADNKEAHQSGCDIKGNISSRGKILFSPGSRGYDSVKVDPQAGEKWFCSVEQAEEAGWRQAKY